MNEDISTLEKKILQYIREYYTNPSSNQLRPSIDSCIYYFKNEYPPERVQETLEALISEGILQSHSFHAYLDFNPIHTERLKTSSEEE